MQGLEALPPWAQVTLSVIGFLATAAIWAKGLLSKGPAPTGDVIVPSMTVANAEVIERLTESLREANRLAREQHDMHLRLEAELKRLCDHTMETKQAVWRLLERN
jgi:hypothetical protein